MTRRKAVPEVFHAEGEWIPLRDAFCEHEHGPRTTRDDLDDVGCDSADGNAEEELDVSMRNVAH